MLRPKKELKISNAAKEVLEELSLWQKVQAFWVTNQKMVSYAGIGIAVVIVGIVLYVSRQNANTREASLALSRIESYYDAGQWQKAIEGDSSKTVRGQQVKGLKAITEEYGGTAPGKVASLMLGNSYYYLGKYEEARTAFRDAESISDATLSAAAFAGQAAIEESLKKFAEAAKLFERAATITENNPNNPEYVISAARCFAQSLQVSKAVELYRRVVFEFAGTNAEETARHALAELHVEL